MSEAKPTELLLEREASRIVREWVEHELDESYDSNDTICEVRRINLADLEERIAESLRTRTPSPAQAEWLPIESASDDQVGLFWLGWASDFAALNKPLSETVWVCDQLFMGKRRCWSSMYQATHWMPLPQPPKEDKQ